MAHAYAMDDDQVAPSYVAPRYIPKIADDEAVRIANHYGMSHGSAKMLKALSFGVYCDVDTLYWAFGSKAQDPSRSISHEIARIEYRTGIDIRFQVGLGYQIIRELDRLHVRAIINGEAR